MHVLHGTWIPEQDFFFLWGEDTDMAYCRTRDIVHPYALDADQLLRHLDRIAPNSAPNGEMMSWWLPSQAFSPMPSPEAINLGAPHQVKETSPPLREWLVFGLTLTLLEAFEMLSNMPDQLPDCHWGEDLFYWKSLALWAHHQLVNGHFLPSMEPKVTGVMGRWQGTFHIHDPDYISNFMPGACLGFIPPDSEAKPHREVYVKGFINQVIDQFVRTSHAGVYYDPWLKSLMRPRPTLIENPPPNIDAVQPRLQFWHLHPDDRGDPFDLYLRLYEPIQDEWMLDIGMEIFLELEDETFYLPMQNILYKLDPTFVTVLYAKFPLPPVQLSLALHKVIPTYPRLLDALEDDTEGVLWLSTTEAWDFLSYYAEKLVAQGVKVHMPDWYETAAEISPRARLTPRKSAGPSFSYLTKQSLLSYVINYDIDGTILNADEVNALIAQENGLYPHGESWIKLDAHQRRKLKEALAMVSSHQGTLTISQALSMVAKGAQDVLNLDIPAEAIELEEEIEELFERMRQPEYVPVPTIPADLNATLRPYQEQGFAWLVQMRGLQMGACLADDMGLGKTIQTIAYWLYVREHEHPLSPSLVVCPTSVVGNWQHEIEQFAPSLKVIKHQGQNREKNADFLDSLPGVDIVLTSYPLLQRDIDTLQQIGWSSVVLDEAQNIKNPSTKQAQAARRLEAYHRIVLTGTPLENRLLEIWSLSQFMNPNYLGSQASFKRDFVTPIEKLEQEEPVEALRKLMAPIILRRVKTDKSIIKDLPEKFENKVYCTLSTEQAKLYQQAVVQSMDHLNGETNSIKRKGNILSMITRLRQICNHPAQFHKEDAPNKKFEKRSGKTQRLMEMIGAVQAVNERMLIFTQYATMGQLLQAFLQTSLNQEVLFLYGATRTDKREEMMQRFQSENGPSIFILSLKAGGTGLNLTRANHVFHFDRWYNPAVENQATDRVFRIGQQRNVQVHKFITLGTLEERIDDLIEKKKSLADQIVGGSGESWISEMDDNALQELVMLRQDRQEG